jgi:hypothetical protein
VASCPQARSFVAAGVTAMVGDVVIGDWVETPDETVAVILGRGRAEGPVDPIAIGVRNAPAVRSAPAS